MTPRTAALGIVVLIALAAVALYVTAPPAQAPVQNTNEAAVRAVITDFGSTLKNVSLLAPDAAAQIQAQYALYVAPGLLAQWVASTTQAPGRSTSSPWPDRIEVVSVEQIGEGAVYHAEGNVVEVTSADQEQPAATHSVQLDVENRAGVWLITSYAQD